MASLKVWWRESRPGLVSGLLYAIIRTLGMTYRIKVHGDPTTPPGGKVFCGWHGKSLVFENYFRGKGVWVIISPSRDGEIQASLFRKMGYKIIRGSTGREGVRAAIEAIKQLKQGETLAMTPDGPRGPSGVVQPGVVVMAQKSGAALIPVGITANRKWTINSWDKHMIPKPFAKAVIVFGEPIIADGTMDQEAVRAELEKRIHQLEAEAEELIKK